MQKLFDFIDDTTPSPDRRPRGANEWIGILIHHTGVGGRKQIEPSLWQSLRVNIARWLATQDSTYVSAHFLIGRGGEITQLVNPDFDVAFHAGTSSFWNPQRRQWMSGMNDHMIGIELLGDGNDIPYSQEQYLALARLSSELMKRYLTIQPHCITGHEVVAPGRKSDPGLFFNWRLFFKVLYQSY